MTEYGGVEDFIGKISWEDGTGGALDYGLTTKGYDLPPDLEAAWDQLYEEYHNSSSLWADVEALIQKYTPEGW